MMEASQAGERRGRAAAAAAVGAGVTFVLTLVVLRRGLAFGPDAWNYWAASVALLEGRGYVDAHGLSVRSGPPLYSAWLAVVQAAGGVSIASVRLADAIANAAFAGSLCGWLLLRVPYRGATWPVAAFSAATALGAVRGAGSEYPMHALLFSNLLLLEWWRRAGSGRAVAGAVVAMALTASLLAAVRHAALAFVGATVVWIVLTPSRSWVQRLAAIVCLGLAVGATCVGIHVALDSGRVFTWFDSDRTAWGTATTMLSAIGRDVGPFPLGLLVWFTIGAGLTVPPLRRRLTRALGTDARVMLQHGGVLFVWISLLAVFVMFLVVPVADPPGGRFVRFASVMLAGLGVAVVAVSPNRKLRNVLLLVLLLPPVLHASKHVVLGRSGRDTVDADGGESWLPPNATLRRGVAAGTVVDGGLVVVQPPLFAWQRERLERGEGR